MYTTVVIVEEWYHLNFECVYLERVHKKSYEICCYAHQNSFENNQVVRFFIILHRKDFVQQRWYLSYSSVGIYTKKIITIALHYS